MTIDDLKIRKFKTTYYTLDRGDFEYIFTIRDYDDSFELWYQWSDRCFDFFVTSFPKPCDIDFRQYIWDNLEYIIIFYRCIIYELEKEDPK